MAEPSPAQKLAQLRQRWERDPKSRVFLQLADEYRRAGRLSEAVRVLESGLAAHPGYVAAQVVLGRCLLETGDSARAVNVLERAIASDPTQIVANRLLVDAYLGVEDVRKARERLDLYRLLNDRDGEIEVLESRIAAAGGEMRPVAVRIRPPRERSGEFEVSADVAAIDAGPFEAPQPIAPDPPPDSPATATFAAAEVVRPRSEQPFGRLRGREDVRRIVTTISAAGIFPVAVIAARPPAVAWVQPSVEPLERATTEFAALSFDEPAPAPAPAPVPFETAHEPPAVAAFEFEPSAPDLEVPELDLAISATDPEPGEAPQSVAGAAVATATLGSLYLAQGHLDDAAESFEAALDRNPDDSGALTGLAEVRRRKSAEAAAFADESVEQASPAAPVVGGMTARKIERLRQFMASMRRRADAHVS